MLERVLGISVTKPNGAIDAVARGLSRIHTFLPAKSKIKGKNITDKLAKYYEQKKEKQ